MAVMAICRKDIGSRRPPEMTDPAEVPGAPESKGSGSARVTGKIRLLRLAQVIEVTGLGKTKIYELQADGSFPSSVPITGHTVGWVESEIQEWLATRVALRRARQSATISG
jgi:prophage regulatory protein